MYYKRELEDKIKVYIDKPKTIAVLGPRQVGKTTLLKKIYIERNKFALNLKNMYNFILK
jgi:predicted AAA+ superfamily ATPase